MSSKLRFADTQASVLLDAVRGLAAVVVVIEHWRNLFFVDYNQVALHRVLFAPLYLLASAGHQAVMIFFVLSGYLISGSVFRMFEQLRWSWETYTVHRLLRLWIVLIPGLLLTAVLDAAGTHIHRLPASLLYGGSYPNHMTGNVAYHEGWVTGFGNILFLQGIKVQTFGSDGALWSLANEFWYYVLFPLGYIAFRSKSSRKTRVVSTVLFLAVAMWLPHGILVGFPIWLLGAVLTRLRPPAFRAAGRWFASAVYMVLFFGFARLPSLQGAWADPALGLITLGWLWLLLSASDTPAMNGLRTKSARSLARFSFTLYVVHTPILMLFAALTLPVTRWQPRGAVLLQGAVFLVITLTAAWLIASITEFQTDRLRGRIEHRLKLQVAPLRTS